VKNKINYNFASTNKNFIKMKRILLSLVIIISGLYFGQNITGFKAGVHAGLPTGDIKDIYSVNMGADVAYTFLDLKIAQIGLASGYSQYVGKDLGGVKLNTGIIPVAATGKVNLVSFFVGADVGYAFFTGDHGNETGGFYYQPKLGFNLPSSEIYLAYKGVSVDGGTFSSVNAGFNWKF